MSGNWKKGMASPNPSGRPKGRTSEVLTAIKSEFGSEPEFWKHIAAAAKGGDFQCLNMIAARLRPPMKARSACVELDITGTTSSDFTAGVLSAVANGELPPDEASSLLNAILAGSKLEQWEALEIKVDELLGVKHGNPRIS